MTMRLKRERGRRATGFTLVELMVAMVLSLVVIGGALMVYMSSSSSYRAQEATAQMVESGRTAVEMISRDLRMAEYWKCIGWQTANLSNHLPYQQRGIYSDNGANGAPDTLRMLQALDETAVTLTADVELTQLINNPAPTPDEVVPQDLSVSSGSGFAADDIIVVNDCAKGEVFQITGVEGNTLQHECLSCVEAYTAGAEVLRVEDVQYFIDDTTDPDNPKLMRIVDGAAAEELLEGVEDLQVHFGEDIDSDGIANRYVTADVINEPCADGTNHACWLRVPTVRISLLLRTVDDNITQEPQSFIYNGSTVTAADGRLRRAFTAVVALRNQFNN